MWRSTRAHQPATPARQRTCVQKSPIDSARAAACQGRYAHHRCRASGSGQADQNWFNGETAEQRSSHCHTKPVLRSIAGTEVRSGRVHLRSVKRRDGRSLRACVRTSVWGLRSGGGTYELCGSGRRGSTHSSHVATNLKRPRSEFRPVPKKHGRSTAAGRCAKAIEQIPAQVPSHTRFASLRTSHTSKSET